MNNPTQATDNWFRALKEDVTVDSADPEDKEGAMASLAAAFPDAKSDRRDGVTVDCGNWWCNVRASNTEPLLRLNLEAETPEAVTDRVAEISPLLGNRVNH